MLSSFLMFMLALFSPASGVVVSNYSLYNTALGSSCSSGVCNDGHTEVVLLVSNLKKAYGNVTIKISPFGDFSDNSSSGGYGFYNVWIGSEFITGSTPGIISGATSDGLFRKTNGIKPNICCFTEGNNAILTVTNEFFNEKLGAFGINPDQLEVIVHVPFSSNTPCVADNNNCSNIDNGQHAVRVDWISLSWQTFSACLKNPNSNITDNNCKVYDIDGDDDVDLEDVSLYNGEVR